jgi:hypothetical protein
LGKQTKGAASKLLLLRSFGRLSSLASVLRMSPSPRH